MLARRGLKRSTMPPPSRGQAIGLRPEGLGEAVGDGARGAGVVKTERVAPPPAYAAPEAADTVRSRSPSVPERILAQISI